MARSFYIPTEQELDDLRRGKISRALFVLIVVIAVIVGCLLATVDVFVVDTNEDEHYTEKELVLFDFFDANVINDLPYVAEKQIDEFTYSAEKDLQLPELPTGCEATACSTLLRMYGFDASKTDVADAMPKSNNPHDFMSCFIGNPYSEHGWAIASPGIAKVANNFVFGDYEAVAVRGVDLSDIDLPAELLVTIDLADADFTDIADDGFPLYHNAHAVVLVSVNNDTVDVIDPLKGEVTYNRAKFESVYKQCGMQTVIIRNKHTY